MQVKTFPPVSRSFIGRALVWRRDSCVRTSQHLPGSEGTAGKLDRDSLSGTVVTGQGVQWVQIERRDF